jgi:ankyrin repeat protein
VSTKELVNQLTFDGNSPLMWASWSGTLDTVKLMIRSRAEHTVANRNGCTVAHWAASGGNFQVCDYLGSIVKVDFSTPNHGGNTALTHAVAFGRIEVVKWIREKLSSEDDDEIAAQLAEDFCVWTDGDAKRKKVLQLFRDDYWDDRENDGDVSVHAESQLELEEL